MTLQHFGLQSSQCYMCAEHSCLVGSTNPCPTILIWFRVHACPLGLASLVRSEHQIRTSWRFMDVTFFCAHCAHPRPNVLRPFHMFSSPTLPDDCKCLFSRSQTNDRAQVSMNIHIQHLGSKSAGFSVPGILLRVGLSRFMRSNTNKNETCSNAFILWVRVENQLNSILNSLTTAQMKSLRMHPLEVLPSCGTPTDGDLRSTLSVAKSLSTIICNVYLSMGSSFNVQSRVPMKYLQMRLALCMSRAEGLCTPLAHYVWEFSNDDPQFAHNHSVQTVFTRRMHIATRQTSTRQQTVEEFCKRILSPS